MTIRDMYTNKEWQTLRIQAAISVMQGLQESGKMGEALELVPDEMAKMAIIRADALMNQLAKQQQLE